MKGNADFIRRMNAWRDRTGEKLKKREMAIPTDLVGGGFFLVFGIGMLFVIPNQIIVKKREIINGRQFPALLMYVMIACAAVLVISQIIKIIRHQEIKRTKISMLTEVKALIIFADMLAYYFICRMTGSFAAGSCVFAALMLMFFRCGKWHYYIITLAAALLIWAAFRFGLHVDF